MSVFSCFTDGKRRRKTPEGGFGWEGGIQYSTLLHFTLIDLLLQLSVVVVLFNATAAAGEEPCACNA